MTAPGNCQGGGIGCAEKLWDLQTFQWKFQVEEVKQGMYLKFKFEAELRGGVQ